MHSEFIEKNGYLAIRFVHILYIFEILYKSYKPVENYILIHISEQNYMYFFKVYNNKRILALQKNLMLPSR